MMHIREAYMSRTTVDLNDELVEEALAITEAPTKKAVIEQALQELVNARKREAIIAMIGSGSIDMTLEELLEMRRSSRRFD
jgi:Arc/MetJ family transcription regulator